MLGGAEMRCRVLIGETKAGKIHEIFCAGRGLPAGHLLHARRIVSECVCFLRRSAQQMPQLL